MDTILRNIRTDLRLSMNGVTASSIRAKGVGYRMNFGVDILRIKKIASKYVADKVLAETMWGDDVREFKILATMLYPVEEFTIDDAHRWARDVVNQEIREQVCKNLFQSLPFADSLVPVWVSDEDEVIRTTGYWLFARLCIARREFYAQNNVQGVLESAMGDLKSESLLLRQSALNSLKFFGRISPQNAANVMELVGCFEHSSDLQEKEMFDLLLFEFEQ